VSIKTRPLPIVPDGTWEDRLDWFRSLSTSTLKHMWDTEGVVDIHCDEIHRVMNERGEGHYVAV